MMSVYDRGIGWGDLQSSDGTCQIRGETQKSPYWNIFCIFVEQDGRCISSFKKGGNSNDTYQLHDDRDQGRAKYRKFKRRWICNRFLNYIACYLTQCIAMISLCTISNLRQYSLRPCLGYGWQIDAVVCYFRPDITNNTLYYIIRWISSS